MGAILRGSCHAPFFSLNHPPNLGTREVRMNMPFIHSKAKKRENYYHG
jgi:hypothetical protein